MIGVHGDHRHLGQLTGFCVKPNGYIPGSLDKVTAKLREKGLRIVGPIVFNRLAGEFRPERLLLGEEKVINRLA